MCGTAAVFVCTPTNLPNVGSTPEKMPTKARFQAIILSILYNIFRSGYDLDTGYLFLSKYLYLNVDMFFDIKKKTIKI